MFLPVTNVRGNMEKKVGHSPITPLLPSRGNTWFVQGFFSLPCLLLCDQMF